MVENKPFQFSSFQINWKQNLLLKFIAALYSATVVLIIFLAFDGNEWYIISGGLGPNIALLLGTGFLFGHFYFHSEFKRFKNYSVFFHDQLIDIKKDGKIIMSYPKKSFVRVNINSMFYNFLGLKKVNLLFEFESKKKLKIESFLIQKNDVQAVLSQIQDFQSSR